MGSFTGKTFSNFYKNILATDQPANTGIDVTPARVQDGAGQNTVLGLATNILTIVPVDDNSTSTMSVTDKVGRAVLAVDTVNKKVLVGEGQVAANTNYAIFGVHYQEFTNSVANTHYPIPFGGGGLSATNDVDFGTGPDPDDTFTTANTDTQYAGQIVHMIWRLPDNITIDSVTSIEGADASAGDTTRMHLKSFDFSSGSTSCLTGGTLLAHNEDVTNAGNEQAYLSTWTVDSEDVDADKVILAFFRSDSVNSDYSITVTVKYHLR